MSREITCPKCGARTLITSMFCVECGEKIDFSKIKPEHLKHPVEVGKVVGRIVRLLFSLAVFGGAGLTLWPAAPAGEVGTETQARECRMKMVRLHDAAENWIRVPVVLDEGEINAYIGAIVDTTREESEGRTPANLERVNFDIHEADMVVVVIAKLAILKISYLVRGVPSAGEGGFQFDLQSAKLGHLPLPGPLKDWAAGRIRAIFSGLEAEQTILARSDRVDLKEGKVRVVTQQR